MPTDTEPPDGGGGGGGGGAATQLLDVCEHDPYEGGPRWLTNSLPAVGSLQPYTGVVIV